MTRQVTIDHLGAGGDGVVVAPSGKPLYVPFALAGEVMDITITGKQIRIQQIHTPSPDRIVPLCPHFGRCGGCAMQHLAAPLYARWKVERLQRALKHQGFDSPVILPLKQSPPASRRRARLTATADKAGKLHLGFAARASHQIIDIAACPVLSPAIMAFTGPLRDFLRREYAGYFSRKNQKMTIQITQADNGLDVVLGGAGEVGLDQRMALAAFAETQDIARLCWQDSRLKVPYDEILGERRKPYVRFGGHPVFFPPGAFLQATKAGEQALMARMQAILAERNLKKTDKIVDLFAGCGTFTMALAEKYTLHAVEGNAAMGDALKNSARHSDRIGPVTTVVRDLFRRPLLPHELAPYAAIILDPPRAGAQAQIQEIGVSQVRTVVMISCNPATFARDAAHMRDQGFQMGAVLPIDQFLYSPHLEIIAGFTRD